LSAHNYKTTGPIAEIQTVLESAHRGEGPIFLKLFLEKNWVFFLIFFDFGLLGLGGLTRAKPGNYTSFQYSSIKLSYGTDDIYVPRRF
jgi:hypothetical protein